MIVIKSPKILLDEGHKPVDEVLTACVEAFAGKMGSSMFPPLQIFAIRGEASAATGEATSVLGT